MRHFSLSAEFQSPRSTNDQARDYHCEINLSYLFFFCIVSLKKLKLDLSISILLLALHVSCTLQIPIGYIISSVLLLKEKENIPEERNFVAQNEVIRWEKAEKELISGRNQWPWKKMPPSKTPRFVSREKENNFIALFTIILSWLRAA